MAQDTDLGPDMGDGPDWAVLALAPLALAGMMLVAAAAFAEGTGDPAQDTAIEEGAAQATDCVATAGETVDGMPATKHQEQVLETEADAAAMEPAAGCPEAGEPSTEHQTDVLDPDKEDTAPAQ